MIVPAREEEEEEEERAEKLERTTSYLLLLGPKECFDIFSRVKCDRSRSLVNAEKTEEEEADNIFLKIAVSE